MSAHAEPLHGQHDEHHGPPPANQSSRVDRATLGMLLFIGSEIMLFGSFFAAYFFVRVVDPSAPAEWPPAPYELPVFVAGMNTASSSPRASPCTGRCSRSSAATARPQAGLALTFLLGLDLPLHPGHRVPERRLHAARRRLRLGLLRPHRPARRARLRRPDACCSWRRSAPSAATTPPEDHHGVEIPGIYWHFVDVMWIVVYTTVYIL